MENRGSKAMALAALIVGVVGLTIGFAAFSTSLTIKPTANVKTEGAEKFEAAFGFGEAHAKSWTATIEFTQSGEVGAVAETKSVTNTVENDSAYDAVTTTTTGSLTGIKCTAGEGATDALVQKACTEITGTYTLPATVAAGQTGEAKVEMVGPTTQVDGPFSVTFDAITANYQTTGTAQ